MIRKNRRIIALFKWFDDKYKYFGGESWVIDEIGLAPKIDNQKNLVVNSGRNSGLIFQSACDILEAWNTP